VIKLVPALGFQVALEKFGDYDYNYEIVTFSKDKDRPPTLHVTR